MKRLLAVFIAIILLTGCGTLKEMFTFTEKAKDRPDLYYTAAYSLAGPNVGLSAKHPDETVEADIETDQYGRELFTVWIPGFVLYNLNGTKAEDDFRPTSVKVILQKHNDNKIYYYEDFCFLLETEDGFPSDKIDTLKAKNDWGTPLQMEKCSSRIYGDYKCGNLTQFDSTIESRIKQCVNGAVTVYPVVADINGKILCGVSTYLEHEDRYKGFYVIYDPSIQGVDIEKGIMEIKTLDFGEELHELKIRNGWNFTECPEVSE
jgi:hypothetical protein